MVRCCAFAESHSAFPFHRIFFSPYRPVVFPSVQRSGHSVHLCAGHGLFKCRPDGAYRNGRILGAFLAGLVLNRLIPHSAPLMHHLEFVGNALFIPYFLIGVGMIIDLRVLFGSGEALKVAAVMITMALAGKWIASWVTQKAFKMSVLERELMFGLSNGRCCRFLCPQTALKEQSLLKKQPL